MKKNVFITVLSFLVVGLAGFIAYSNFFVDNLSTDNTQDCKKIETVKNKTADERYKEYLDNLVKSIKKTYVNSNKEDDYSTELSNITYVEKKDMDPYSISITKDLILTVGGEELSDKAVSYFNVHTGNGDYNTLYFITTEGKVYSANYESSRVELKEPEVKEITGLKNIIEVKDGSSTAGVPIFVDIDGNLYTK